MKIYRSIAFWAFLLLLTCMSQARNRNGLFLGVSSDLFSAPLTESGILTRASSVTAGYALTESLNVNLLWENRLVLDPALSFYESKNGIGLGVGYRIMKQEQLSSLELNFQLVKAPETLFSADNLSAQAGVRWLFTDNFFLGTGLRYESWESTNLSAGASGSYNWYCQLGLRVFTGTQKKNTRNGN